MPAHIPPAPQLPQEALIEVFTYPDPARPLDPNNRFSNARRLEFFGSKVAEALYVEVMFQRWPRANAPQLQNMTTSGFRAFVERVVAAYEWPRHVQGPFPPGVNLQSAEEAHRIFFTYAGAVKVQYGYTRLHEWFAELQSARI